MAGSYDTRVVVTGIGVVSPIGIGKDVFWNHLIEGHSGIDFLKSYPSDNLPSKLAAEITDFDPLAYVYQKKFLKVMSRDIQLGVSAASMAVRDSGITPGAVDPLRMGVEFGAGHISFTPEELAEAAADFVDPSNRDGYPRWGDDQMGKIAPLWLLRQLPNMPACHVAIEHDCQGPNNTITNGEPSALLALNEAMRVINATPWISVVRVGGHADAVGTAMANEEISVRRCRAVISYMQSHGLRSGVELVPVAYGSHAPIASNDTEQGRMLNRRVVFMIRNVKYQSPIYQPTFEPAQVPTPVPVSSPVPEPAPLPEPAPVPQPPQYQPEPEYTPPVSGPVYQPTFEPVPSPAPAPQSPQYHQPQTPSQPVITAPPAAPEGATGDVSPVEPIHRWEQ